MNFLQHSVFFGVVITLIAFQIGQFAKKKWKIAIFNPLLIGIILVIAFLKLFHLDYQVYADGAKYISYFLTPATVALAIPLYEQVEALKQNWKAILLGIISGGTNKCSLCACYVHAVRFKSHPICYTSSKINYDSNWYGSI